MTFKRVMTFCPREKKVRLFRLAWDRIPNFYFKKRLSVGLVSKPFQFWKEYDAFFLTIFFVQFHMKFDCNGSMPE